LPRGVQGVDAGEKVNVHLLKSKKTIENTIFCIGSHDVILDLLAQFLSERDRRFVSSNVGSQGGLIALRRGEAHLAGSHLLDPATGEYNIRYIHEYLSGTKIIVIGFVNREQGLIVKKGNPKTIKNIQDLVSSDILYVNRQRGAGTRILFDYQLKRLGIAPETIRGYAVEEFTHLGVAAAIASGRADCGLGIPAAAQALNLDFLPLYQERYDLVIPEQFAQSELLGPLFDVLSYPEFLRAIQQLPGYETSPMGKILFQT